MKDAGFFTVSSILMRTKKVLCEIKGLSEPKIDKIRDAAVKICGNGFISGTEVRQRRQSVYHVNTGSEALNELIGGGIETGSITEAFGKLRTYPSRPATHPAGALRSFIERSAWPYIPL